MDTYQFNHSDTSFQKINDNRDEKERMFEKIVTPSDVGKLNRLVIPKQYAEKYFPLHSSVNEKGLILNFEDRTGKSWRFRYSYWNSSQSYVMTKGWSRFVKEKHLGAGDTVFFEKGVGELCKNRLYIDCRHRIETPCSSSSHVPLYHPLILTISQPETSFAISSGDAHFQDLRFDQRYRNYSLSLGCNLTNPSSMLYLKSSVPSLIHPGEQVNRGSLPIFGSVPVLHGKAAAKRVRLFGVNLDCPITDVDEDMLSQISPSTIDTISSDSHFSPPSSEGRMILQMNEESLSLDLEM